MDMEMILTFSGLGVTMTGFYYFAPLAYDRAGLMIDRTAMFISQMLGAQ